MNRNRILGFLAALAVLAGAGVAVFLMFREDPGHRGAPIDTGPAITRAAPHVAEKPDPSSPLAPPRPGELAPSKPRQIGKEGGITSEAGLGGIVTNEAGVPIDRAIVELYEDLSAIKDRTQEGELRDRQETSSEGLFLFEKNLLSMAERYVLKVMHPMYVTERKALDAKKLDPVIYVRLKLGTAITGTVRTSAGAALAGATVTVFDMNQGALDPNGSVESFATTDASGAYAVNHVSPGIKKVQASAQGYASLDRQALQVEQGKPLANLDFSLNDGASITGQVFSTEGKPVSGAFVTARPVRIGPKPDPNVMAQGAREIEEQRKADVLSREAAMRGHEQRNEDQRAAREAEAKEMREALIMKEKEREAAKEPSMAKQRGVVQQAPPTSNTTISVRTKDDGSFVVAGTEIGSYTISVNAPGYVTPAQQTVESPSSGVAFQLAPNARILGRVVDDDSRRPVAMFTVGLTTTPDEVLIPQHSRKSFGPPKFNDGNFEMLDVKPGRYWLVADAPGYAGGRSEEIVITQGERREGIEIRIVRGATIRGRVVEATGKPIAGATVQPEPASLSAPGGAGAFLGAMLKNLRRDVKETKTGQDGTYALPNMLSGSYTLSVSHPEYGPASTTSFTVGTAGELQQPDVVLSRGATIKGRVKLADGQPDTKAMVQVSLIGNAPNFSGHRSAYTDSEGRFEVNGLAVGQYRVVVSQRNGQPDLSSLFTSMKTPNTLSLGEGETKEIDL
jgi:protocatechuate 3,4-dioxygenase beta subunit